MKQIKVFLFFVELIFLGSADQLTTDYQTCLDIIKLIDSRSDSRSTLVEIYDKSELLGNKLNTVTCNSTQGIGNTLLQYTLFKLKSKIGNRIRGGEIFRIEEYFESYDDLLKSYKREFKIAEILMHNGAKATGIEIRSVLQKCSYAPDEDFNKPIVSEIENEISRFLNVMVDYGVDFKNTDYKTCLSENTCLYGRIEWSYYAFTSNYGCTRNAEFLMKQGNKIIDHDVLWAKRWVDDSDSWSPNLGNIDLDTAPFKKRYQKYYKLVKKIKFLQKFF